MNNWCRSIASLAQAIQRQTFALSALWLALVLVWHPTMANPPAVVASMESEVLEMSLEDLLDVQVTSVSKRPQSLSDAAAAVFVISNEDLRRSGATSIPDALRMVPGINVARIDANKWAVTARGFNGRFANKLLVLVDGRSIYSPSFSGVYWEMQDVMLEDVERIEVIRGPGATIWGANAVNGVINIITRHAADTQGGLAVLGGGSEERGFASGRYGARLGEGTYGRIYAKTFKRDEFVNPDGGNAGDDWKAMRGGFRLDSQLGVQDGLTVQGEIHSGDINKRVALAAVTPPFIQQVEDSASIAGGNILARWEHTSSAVSSWSLQAYYDRFERDEVILSEERDTFDLDLTHRLVLYNGHEIVWGLVYRYTQDDFTPTRTIGVVPASRSDHLFSVFVQDELELVQDSLWLTLGSKFEHNDYTGFEVQPSVRLAWTLDPRNKLWTSVSRAVRTPSRGDHDLRIANLVLPPFSANNPTPFPLVPSAVGNPDMESEEVIAYEVGYRVAPSGELSLDLAGYYNRYENLRTFTQGVPRFNGIHLVAPNLFDNGAEGTTYGIELAAAWQAMESTRLDLAYSFMETNVDWLNPFDQAQNTAAPRHQASLRSSTNLDVDLDLDVWLRYVGDTQVINTSLSADSIGIDGYLTLDVRLAWRPMKDLELSLVGQNLLDSRHLEYIQEAFTLPTGVERGVYGRIELKF